MFARLYLGFALATGVFANQPPEPPIEGKAALLAAVSQKPEKRTFLAGGRTWIAFDLNRYKAAMDGTTGTVAADSDVLTAWLKWQQSIESVIEEISEQEAECTASGCAVGSDSDYYHVGKAQTKAELRTKHILVAEQIQGRLQAILLPARLNADQASLVLKAKYPWKELRRQTLQRVYGAPGADGLRPAEARLALRKSGDHPLHLELIRDLVREDFKSRRPSAEDKQFARPLLEQELDDPEVHLAMEVLIAEPLTFLDLSERESARHSIKNLWFRVANLKSQDRIYWYLEALGKLTRHALGVGAVTPGDLVDLFGSTHPPVNGVVFFRFVRQCGSLVASDLRFQRALLFQANLAYDDELRMDSEKFGLYLELLLQNMLPEIKPDFQRFVVRMRNHESFPLFFTRHSGRAFGYREDMREALEKMTSRWERFKTACGQLVVQKNRSAEGDSPSP